MKAHDSYLISLLKLSGAVFNIPVYQRNYDWDTENCQQLFSDLETISVTGKDHFIGSIVYISIGTATEPYYNIIDGQQRITSVMLFLKALHDSSDDEKFRKQIKRGFLTNLDLDDEPKMKLKQVESDSGVYEKIVMQESFDESAFTDPEKNSNVYRNYRYFMDAVAHSEISVGDLYNAVYKLEIIDVCLTTEDPQEVFESMNSTGKSLTNTDLLRNYLLMDLPHSKQEQYYKKYWSQIEKNVGAKQMDLYMAHYLIMKRKSDSINIRRKSAKINRSTLYDCYKIYFPPEKKKDSGTEDLLKDICRYSSIYRRIVNEKNPKTNLDKAIYELITELNAEAAGIFIMYLLKVQEDEGITNDDMVKAVNACISYSLRLRIFKSSITNQFFALAIQYYEKGDTSKPFIDRVWAALNSGQGRYRFPKNREFQDAFETMNMYLEFKPQMIRYILYKYERARSKEVVDPENATIEHIIPQDTKKWVDHLKEVGDTAYLEQIHKIGNLTLTKLNSEASNSPFNDKKDIYKKSNYAMTREIASFADWTSSEVKKRSESMAKEALQLWPLPDEYNKDISASTWQFNVMDDSTEELFDSFCETLKEYHPSVYEEPKKQYVNFIQNKKIVMSVIPYQTYLMVTLNADPESLKPSSGLEDIRNKGHWGVGNCRMKVETEEDTWKIMDYVQQIIDKKLA